MKDKLLDELLHEEESAMLDFKRDQYPFSGATEEEKSELLKDILAFVNAWRRTAAYIVIGVEDVKGGRGLPRGVAQHLNDNDLQQFVNSKTNRPISFAYKAHTFEGVQLGIIEIPPQGRPAYLKKAYGRLAAGTVYVRRGSSTDIAAPDEVASMGAADTGHGGEQPAFELEWADILQRSSLGVSVELVSLVLTPQLSPRALMPRANALGIAFDIRSLNEPGETYYRELIAYAYDSEFLKPIGFRLRNTSAIAAESVVVTGKIGRVEGVRLYDWNGEPVKPSKYPYLASLSRLRSLGDQLGQNPDPLVREFPEHFEVTVPFGQVLPKQTVWSSDVLYVGAVRATTLSFAAQLYSKNLPHPQAFMLTVAIRPESRPMTHSDLSDGV